MTTLTQEFHRVFGSAHETETGQLYADGWPQAYAYTDAAIEVLRRFPDGHGLTEEGDAEVCTALEQVGAFTVGSRVESGETPEDHDTGTILEIQSNRALVAWDSQVRTWQPLEMLRAI